MFGLGHGSPLNLLLDFRSNLVNWLLLMGIILWLCRKYLPPLFSTRKESIDKALALALQSRREAQQFLEEQKAKVRGLEKEAEQILEEAKVIAQHMRQQIQDETKKEVSLMLQKFETQITNERRSAVTEIREAAVGAALKLTETYLVEHVSEAAENRLLNQFIEQLDTVNGQEQSFIGGRLESVHNRQ